MAQILIFSDCNGSLGLSRYAGPYRVVTELREHGYEARVIDFFTSYSLETLEKIINTYVDKSTLIVGFSSTLWTKVRTDEEIVQSLMGSDNSMRSFYNGLWVNLFPQSNEFIDELFKIIKGRNPNIKIVVGGYKATNATRNGIDYWVLGQGEGPIVALANHLYKGEPLDGIKTEYGTILTDKLYPFENFSKSKIIFTKDDHLFPNENIPIETARGCIFKCSFCSFNLNGKRFGEYTKEAETFREELIYNYETFGTTEYMISDDTFNDSMQKVQYFYDLIQGLPFKIKFAGHARLDIIGANMEMAHMLKEMGAKCMEFGIETMNKETGKHIGKLGDREKLIKMLNDVGNIWRDDIYISSGFIIGLPYETEDSIRKTMDYLYSGDHPLTAIQFNKYGHVNPVVLNINGDKEKLTKAGFVKIPSGWVYENLSKMFENPAKYGYKELPNFKWKNMYMDNEVAERLEREFHSDPRARQKKNLSVFHHYNRIRNLGYTHEQIKHLFYDDEQFVRSCLTKSKEMVSTYLNKIL